MENLDKNLNDQLHYTNINTNIGINIITAHPSHAHHWLINGSDIDFCDFWSHSPY